MNFEQIVIKTVVETHCDLVVVTEMQTRRGGLCLVCRHQRREDRKKNFLSDLVEEESD